MSAESKPVITQPLDSSTLISKFTEFAVPEKLAPYWEKLATYPLLQALVVAAVFIIIALILQRVVIRLIKKLIAKTETRFDDQTVDLISKPILKTIILLGTIIAVEDAFSESRFSEYYTLAILTLLTFIWVHAALRLSAAICSMIAQDTRIFKGIDHGVEPLIAIASKLIILLIGAYLVLLIWGINPVGLLASAGVVGLAFGFAAKDTLANLFSGVFILADQPYKLGDYIILDSGERGKVKDIGLRSTRLLTRDDVEISIPNGVIGNSKIINESGGPYPKMRLRIDVQCAYEANLTHVEEVLRNIADESDEVVQYPSPRVRVRNFGDSGIDIQLLCWIQEPELKGRVKHELMKIIHETFKREQIEIPYPKRDIHLFAQEEN